MTAAAVSTLPAVAYVFPPGCGQPGCQAHYRQPHPDCICITWPADRGSVHLFAVNPLCWVHHTVMELIDDAAIDLEMRGYLDPDEDDTPPEIVAVLLELYLAGKCGLCPGWPSPSNLAEHLISRWQCEWERSLPTWTCDCGTVFKLMTAYGSNESFYTITSDGLLDEPAGGVRRNSKGKVKASDSCPVCGRQFAETITTRANPQQRLF